MAGSATEAALLEACNKDALSSDKVRGCLPLTSKVAILPQSDKVGGCLPPTFESVFPPRVLPPLSDKDRGLVPVSVSDKVRGCLPLTSKVVILPQSDKVGGCLPPTFESVFPPRVILPLSVPLKSKKSAAVGRPTDFLPVMADLVVLVCVRLCGGSPTSCVRDGVRPMFVS
jgi:hypothetical protein